MNELNIFNKNHDMIDIETLSTRQNAVIVSIGAVSFTFENGIEHEFMVNVDPMDCIRYGMHVSKDTVQWWKEQNPVVMAMWQKAPKTLVDALTHLSNFIKVDKNPYVWAHGAVFDFGILRSAYELTGVDRGWEYWHEMDDRTVFNLLGINNKKLRESGENYHSALDDARAQAETLISLFT